ncbi:hypothetical protein [Bradyrhizobium sp. HKCCYLS20291]|uniref:hypothetical protein n=1 Tax=Bradyrhizobium sp. HKCCYLS20291 TaxID=3420766 RepID=UPI003EBF0814
MTDIPVTDAPGYIVKVYDRGRDDQARYFVVCGVSDGAEAVSKVLRCFPGKVGEAVRNANKLEVKGLEPGTFEEAITQFGMTEPEFDAWLEREAEVRSKGD